MLVVFLLTSNGEKIDHIKVRPNFVHMAVGSVFAAAIILSHFQLVQILDISALVAISFFNLLFVFLLFPLEGTLLRKIVLLFAGNSVGLLWYLMQVSLEEVSIFFLSTDAFKIITIVVKPIIDFVWIVSIWSLSLSVSSFCQKKN